MERRKGWCAGSGQGCDSGVDVWVVKERYGIPFVTGAIDNPVWRGFKKTIGQTVQHITDIYHKCAVNFRGIHPIPGRRLDLQTAHVILRQQG